MQVRGIDVVSIYLNEERPKSQELCYVARYVACYMLRYLNFNRNGMETPSDENLDDLVLGRPCQCSRK